MVSVKQVAKTGAHATFLIAAMALIGRAVSRTLLELALKLYFGLASAAAALAIVQAVDVNALNGSLTRHLDLVVRAYPNGYKAPVSIFPEPAHLGYFSLTAIVVGVLGSEAIRRRRALSGCALCGAALLLALSVGPILVACALLAVLLVARRRSLRDPNRAWAAGAVVVVLLAGVAVATPAGSAIGDRVSRMVSGKDESSKYRSAVIHASVHPLEARAGDRRRARQHTGGISPRSPITSCADELLRQRRRLRLLVGEAGPLAMIWFLLLTGSGLARPAPAGPTLARRPAERAHRGAEPRDRRAPSRRHRCSGSGGD